jgi:hypothetical protein
VRDSHTVYGMTRTAIALWTISPELIRAIDDHLGPPVDSYVNGSQTWFDEIPSEITLEYRLHPAARYVTPRGMSHYEVWETVVDQLTGGADPHSLRLGEEVRPLTGVWEGLESYAAYGDDLEPNALAVIGGNRLLIPADGAGLVDHDAIGDAWERAQGAVSIVALLREQLGRL